LIRAAGWKGQVARIAALAIGLRWLEYTIGDSKQIKGVDRERPYHEKAGRDDFRLVLRFVRAGGGPEIVLDVAPNQAGAWV